MLQSIITLKYINIFFAEGEVKYLTIIREGEVNIGEYLPSRKRGKYSPIFTEPKANNCFSIILSGEHQKE